MSKQPEPIAEQPRPPFPLGILIAANRQTRQFTYQLSVDPASVLADVAQLIDMVSRVQIELAAHKIRLEAQAKKLAPTIEGTPESPNGRTPDNH